MRKFVVALWILIGFCHCSLVYSAPLKIALLTTSEQQMQVYNKLFSQFELSSGIDIELRFYSDMNFKRQIKGWIERGEFDVLYWQGGARLDRLVNEQVITPLSELVDLTLIKQQYQENTLAALSYQDQLYALPLGHYSWGFYYNKDIFEHLGLTPPNNWSELIEITEKLKKNGIKPFVQANHEKWPVLAWLDYISLRTGGVDYRTQLTQGQFGQSVYDKQLLNAFEFLVSNDLFFAPEHAWRWQQTIPMIARQQAAMTLMGQFAEQEISANKDASIGFFPFPNIALGKSSTAIAPLEVLIFPTSGKQTIKVGKLINFLVDYAAIDSLSTNLGWLSVIKGHGPADKEPERIQAAQRSVDEAKTLIQYFDRDASESISEIWAEAIIAAIQSGQLSSIKALTNASFDKPVTNKYLAKDDRQLLSFSTLSGHRGSFYFSEVLRQAYATLGFDITVSRFESSDAVINSLKFGADGDLVRVEDIAELNQLAIKVPEPIAEVKAYIVGHDQQSCSDQAIAAKSDATAGFTSDGKVFKNLSKRFNLTTTPVDLIPVVWQKFNRRQVDYLFISESELFAKRFQLTNFCYRMVDKFNVYHYVSKKHRLWVDDIANAIKQIKTSDAYQQLSAEAGLGILPNRN